MDSCKQYYQLHTNDCPENKTEYICTIDTCKQAVKMFLDKYPECIEFGEFVAVSTTIHENYIRLDVRYLINYSSDMAKLNFYLFKVEIVE